MSQSAALLLCRDSHLIKKLPPSPSPSRHHQPQQRRHHHHHPVIIYAHSPKVIRSKPQDFMALVQKLTGYTGDPTSKMPPPQQKPEPIIIGSPQKFNNNYINNNSNNMFEEFEDKKSIAVSLNSSYSCGGSVIGRMGPLKDEIEYSTIAEADILSRDGGSSSSPPGLPLFDPPAANSYLFFAPTFSEFCCSSSNNNDIGNLEALINNFDIDCCYNDLPPVVLRSIASGDDGGVCKREAVVNEFRHQFTDFT